MENKIRVWDFPVRFFHWSLAFSFSLCWLTSESETYRNIHFFAGYFLIGIVILRIIYGFIGSKYAKFENFIRGPSEFINYIKNMKNQHYTGHNPLGGIGVLFLMLGTLLTAIFGHYLSLEETHFLEEAHEFLAGLTLGVVVIHILGVIFSSKIHKENLVLSMITGFKEKHFESDDSVSSRLFVGIIFLISSLFFAYFML